MKEKREIILNFEFQIEDKREGGLFMQMKILNSWELGCVDTCVCNKKSEGRHFVSSLYVQLQSHELVKWHHFVNT